MRLIHWIAAFVLVTGISAGDSFGAVVNNWNESGTKPLSLSLDGRDRVAIDCAAKLPAPKGAYERFKAKIDAGEVGTSMTLADGTRFKAMAYKDCHIWQNVEVHFGDNAPLDWRNAEAITVIADDGSIVTYVRPYKTKAPFGCNNWAILEVTPPPRRNPCFVVPFDFTQNAHVMESRNLKIAGALVASGVWKGSDDQAYLNEDTTFAFVVMHMDFANQAEFDSFMQDECTGVRDSTGFHHIVEFNCNMCVRGRWPTADLIDLTCKEHGVCLPVKKPKGAFRFPCAKGKCEFSMSLRSARGVVPCVTVPRYQITLGNHRTWRDEDNFDVVTDTEVQSSLARGKKMKGDVVLSSPDGTIRYLKGAGSYTKRGEYREMP